MEFELNELQIKKIKEDGSLIGFNSPLVTFNDLKEFNKILESLKNVRITTN